MAGRATLLRTKTRTITTIAIMNGLTWFIRVHLSQAEYSSNAQQITVLAGELFWHTHRTFVNHIDKDIKISHTSTGLVLLFVGAALGVGIDRTQQHGDMFALSVGISRLQHSAWTRAPASGSDSDQTRTRQNLMASAPGSDLVLQQQRRMEALVAMDTPWTHVGKCIERNSGWDAQPSDRQRN